MPQENQINYVEFPAKDLPQTKTFFNALFGWTFTDWGEAYCSFNDGQLDGGFYQADTAMATANGSALIVFYANDLESMVDKVKVVGGRIVQPIFSFPGGRRFHFSDPNGNEFAIWSDQGMETGD